MKPNASCGGRIVMLRGREVMQLERACMRSSLGCKGNDAVTNRWREGAEDYSAKDTPTKVGRNHLIFVKKGYLNTRL
jgi:hypothetical protein